MTDNLSDVSNQVSEAKDAETESAETESAEMSVSVISDEFKPWQSFSIAFLAGALLAFVGLSISMEMTGMPLGEVSGIQWAGAATLPFLLGTLAAVFKEPFLSALDAVMGLLPY